MLVKPSLIVTDVTQIPMAWLEAEGIRGFIFDLDNTIMKPHSARLDAHVADWLNLVQAQGYACVVVSNNPIVPYIRQAEQILGFPCIANAGKPRRVNLRKGLEILGFPAHQVVVVGDRPLTDIWGGQRLGAFTVLVDPLNKLQEPPFVQSLRWLERRFIKRHSKSP